MENKKAKNRDEAWGMQQTYTDKPLCNVTSI